jgi:hypothetical protein
VFVLALPQFGETDGGTQLERFRLLAVGNGQGLMEACCGLININPCLLQ